MVLFECLLEKQKLGSKALLAAVSLHPRIEYGLHLKSK